MLIVSPVWTTLYNRNTEYEDTDIPAEAASADGLLRPADTPYTFRVTMAAHAGTERYCALGPGYGWKPLENRVPVLIARRHDTSANFMATLESFRSSPHVSSVEALLDAPEAAMVRVNTGAGQDVIITNYRSGPVDTGELYFDGRFAVLSIREGTPSRCLMIDATRVRLDDFTLTSSHSATFLATRTSRTDWSALTTAGASVRISAEG
jgi:hypothetical protein